MLAILFLAQHWPLAWLSPVTSDWLSVAAAYSLASVSEFSSGIALGFLSRFASKRRL